MKRIRQRHPSIYRGPEGPFGCHVSMAGGFDKAPQRARELGASTFQIFCKPPRNWRTELPADDEATAFRDEVARLNMTSLVAHAGYLSNPASPDRIIRNLSVKTLIEEIRVAAKLGIGFFIIHPGAYIKGAKIEGMKRLSDSADSLEKSVESLAVHVLFETTAGQGSSLGHELDQLAYLIRSRKDPHKFGVCLDTAHVFQAGHDISDSVKLKAFLDRLESACFRGCIKAMHINDSKTGFGSHIDRHASLGKGLLGLNAISVLLKDPRLYGVPKILEVPGGDEIFRRDLKKMARLVANHEDEKNIRPL